MLNSEENDMLHDLAKEQEIQLGKVNISFLSKQTGYDRKTIRKYLSNSGGQPQQNRHLKISKLDPFKEYLCHRIGQFPSLSSIRLYEEIHNQGYNVGVTRLG
jgi:transposase